MENIMTIITLIGLIIGSVFVIEFEMILTGIAIIIITLISCYFAVDYEKNMNKIRKLFFDCIRKLFWKTYCPDEEFACGNCGKEMYRRFIFCSQKCEDKFYDSREDGLINDDLRT